jgi:hypothetical protein
MSSMGADGSIDYKGQAKLSNLYYSRKLSNTLVDGIESLSREIPKYCYIIVPREYTILAVLNRR